MFVDALHVPDREMKPRTHGVTMVIDNGMPTRQFEDVVASYGDYIDLIKLGWCTALVTPDLKYKFDAAADAGVDLCYGGTLFEKYLQQDRFDDWRRLCDRTGMRHVEVSNGTIDLPNERKAEYVAELCRDFLVFSEVGYKDGTKSESMAAQTWIDYLHEDLDAGAHMVITEARESGMSGICTSDGELKNDLIDQIAASDVDIERVMFEAPNKALQVELVQRFGSDVNLGNVAGTDVIGLETLRLGLRSDTLLEPALNL